MALVGSLSRGGAQQQDGFVQLLLVHNDSKPELPQHSSPSSGPELLEHKGWGSLRVSPWLFAWWGLEMPRNGKFWKAELK